MPDQVDNLGISGNPCIDPWFRRRLFDYTVRHTLYMNNTEWSRAEKCSDAYYQVDDTTTESIFLYSGNRRARDNENFNRPPITGSTTWENNMTVCKVDPLAK